MAYRQIRTGVICIFGFALSFGLLGYMYGLWRGPHADYSSWDWAIQRFKVADRWPFVRVAYIHNAGYLGAVVGLVVALTAIRPNRTPVKAEVPNGTEPGVARERAAASVLKSTSNAPAA
jgi:hypothetical protein